MSIELILAITGLILSAFFSGAEIAFVSANPMQIEVWKRQNRRGAGETSAMLENPASFLNITLIGTNIANIMATSFAAILLIQFMNEVLVILVTGVIILTFGEILPKTIFRDKANALTLRITPALKFFQLLLFPFLKIAEWYTDLLTGWIHTDEQLSEAFSKDELRLLFSRVSDNQVIDKHEKRFISKLFTFGQHTAREVMTPRTEISAIELHQDMESVNEAFLESGHAKLPVYEGTIDRIVGIIFLYDLLESHDSIQEIIRDATFVPESKNIGELLREFQENNNSIGIVIDEYGGTAGLITVEDIVEELFGEFEDEFDIDEVTVKKVEGGYVISARTEIDYLNDTLHLGLPQGEYETLGGFLEDRLGRIPTTGEEFTIGNRKYSITKAGRKKIEQVKLLRFTEESSRFEG